MNGTVSLALVRAFYSRCRWVGDCLEWTGARHAQGYGIFSWRVGKSTFTQRAHRFAWAAANGQATLPLLHSCDNPACVRLSHLRQGTAAENASDRDSRGRGAIGERVATARLTLADLPVIRARAARGERYSSIGADYGVTGASISNIVRRRTWRRAEAVA